MVVGADLAGVQGSSGDVDLLAESSVGLGHHGANEHVRVVFASDLHPPQAVHLLSGGSVVQALAHMHALCIGILERFRNLFRNGVGDFLVPCQSSAMSEVSRVIACIARYAHRSESERQASRWGKGPSQARWVPCDGVDLIAEVGSLHLSQVRAQLVLQLGFVQVCVVFDAELEQHGGVLEETKFGQAVDLGHVRVCVCVCCKK